MTLRKARTTGQGLKTCVQENQGLERMRLYLQATESLAREVEAARAADDACVCCR